MYVLREVSAPPIDDTWRVVYSGLDFWGKEIFLLAPAGADLAAVEREVGSRTPPTRRGMAVWRDGQLVPLPDLPQIADTADHGPQGYVFASRAVGVESGDGSAESAENVWFADGDGKVFRGISVGSQFSHLAVDDEGALWVGYRDQAGLWVPPPAAGRPDLADGVLLPGVCRWSPEGHLSWVLSRDVGVAEPGFHCYSLNVSAAGRLAAVDWRNSVVELAVSGGSRFWATENQSPSGLAKRGDDLLLLGRYEWPKRRGGQPAGFDVVSRHRLTGAGLELAEESRLVLADGSALPGVPQGVSAKGDLVLMHFGDVSRPSVLSL